ncbi:Anion exchange protein, partial [Trichostrongylus colubriformis]
RETARWVKFEEDVEQGGNRWSKPHVATLSLHSLFQLRSCLLNGLFMNDMPETDLPAIIEVLINEFVKEGDIEEDMREELREILMRKHVHQYEQAKKNGPNGDKSGFLNTVRSISDIGKSFSHGRNLGKLEKEQFGPQLELPKVESLPRDMNKDGSSGDISKGNTHFLKKLPHGVEASNVLIGEVPVPTRFIFLMLGPTGHGSQYKEIGRAIATLMADEIFHDVAYKARNKEDLLDGVDEFLDQVTVLPPGEWDPTIRIEPPNQIPSQEKRKQIGQEMLLEGVEMCAKGSGKGKEELEEEEGRIDHSKSQFHVRTSKRKYGGKKMESWQRSSTATHWSFIWWLDSGHQTKGAICGVVYHLFSGQPLTIIGSTGPVLVFETIVFDFCSRLGIQYLSFRFWVHVWTALIVFIMCITDASALVSYITRFTEESFATLIAVIFIYEAIMKLWKIKSQLDVINYSREGIVGTCFCEPPTGKPLITIEKAGEYIKKQGLNIAYNTTYVDYSATPLEHCRYVGGSYAGTTCYPLYDKLLMSVLLTIGTFFLAITFKRMRNSCYFPSRVRQIFSDFAVMISIVIMTFIDMSAGVNTPKLHVPSTFRPTWDGRDWFIPPFDGNPFWTAPLAAIPALLACILIFMDQQITTVIVNRKENKLKKVGPRLTKPGHGCS